MGELREECMGSGVSFRVEGNRTAGSAELKLELAERLIMAVCANNWEERGLPVKKIASIQSAIVLQNRWDELEKFGVKDLRKEYAKLGLPSEATAPKVLELLPRLRLASLWQALPAADLQQECRKLGISAPGASEHSDLWQRLVLAKWGPPKSTPQSDSEKTASDDTGPPSSELLQSFANHFRTLELPANANALDLKKAYRRLVLVHHPDKNLDSSQEASAELFRKVVEAYEALDKFMAKK